MSNLKKCYHILLERSGLARSNEFRSSLAALIAETYDGETQLRPRCWEFLYNQPEPIGKHGWDEFAIAIEAVAMIHTSSSDNRGVVGWFRRIFQPLQDPKNGSYWEEYALGAVLALFRTAAELETSREWRGTAIDSLVQELLITCMFVTERVPFARVGRVGLDPEFEQALGAAIKSYVRKLPLTQLSAFRKTVAGCLQVLKPEAKLSHLSSLILIQIAYALAGSIDGPTFALAVCRE